MEYLKEPGQGVMDIKEATDLCSDFYAMDMKKIQSVHPFQFITNPWER